MLVDDLRARECPGERLERSARVRWSAGEVRLRLTVPAQAADVEDDSWLLATTLVTAMRRREPELAIDGRVSPRLLHAVGEIGTFLETWDPSVRLPPVRAQAGSARPGGPATACFASRGVDSTFSAAVERYAPLGALVHVVGVEPRHSEPVRAAEVVGAGAIAEAVRLPLIVAETNARELTDPVLAWHDVVGSVLVGVALGLSRAIGRIVVPSSG